MQDPSLYQQISPQFPEKNQSNCPRCDSNNTKFCYYNNYNLCQPRHYCKNCRRYWTKGGTIRNIPVGGGIRKPTKRSSSSSKSEPSDGYRSVDQDRRMIHTENDQIRSLVQGINSNGFAKNPIFSLDSGLINPGVEKHSGDGTERLLLGVDENGGNSSYRGNAN